VNAPIRFFAALLLAFMLPVQGWAAACAQICAIGSDERHAVMMVVAHADGDQDGAPDHDHCDKSDMGAGKCCQAHTFMVELPIAVALGPIPSFEPHSFVARWTNFIPEEPSPPPIAPASQA
jgi:hypothetical protein